MITREVVSIKCFRQQMLFMNNHGFFSCKSCLFGLILTASQSISGYFIPLDKEISYVIYLYLYCCIVSKEYLFARCYGI